MWCVVVYKHEIVVMGLVLLYAKVSPLCNVLRECLCYSLHINYIVYKHFDRSLHVGSSDPTCVQSFRSVPLMVFEILGFKLKNDNVKKNNWGNEPFAISVHGPILT